MFGGRYHCSNQLEFHRTVFKFAKHVKAEKDRINGIEKQDSEDKQ